MTARPEPISAAERAAREFTGLILEGVVPATKDMTVRGVKELLKVGEDVARAATELLIERELMEWTAKPGFVQVRVFTPEELRDRIDTVSLLTAVARTRKPPRIKNSDDINAYVEFAIQQRNAAISGRLFVLLDQLQLAFSQLTPAAAGATA